MIQYIHEFIHDCAIHDTHIYIYIHVYIYIYIFMISIMDQRRKQAFRTVSVIDPPSRVSVHEIMRFSHF